MKLLLRLQWRGRLPYEKPPLLVHYEVGEGQGQDSSPFFMARRPPSRIKSEVASGRTNLVSGQDGMFLQAELST